MKVTIIQIVIGAFGTVTQGLLKGLEDLEVGGRVEHYWERPEYWEESWRFDGWLVSLFNGISTLFRLFNAKAILLEEQYWYYLTHSWEDKGVHTFPNGICPKVNVIARLEYELAYYDSAVHRFNHYTTWTPTWRFEETYCHSNSCERPLANADVEKL